MLPYNHIEYCVIAIDIHLKLELSSQRVLYEKE